MVVVRGKIGRDTSAARQARTALAVVLTLGAGQACGSRTMLDSDYEEAGSGGTDNGGSSSSGRGGSGTGADGGSYVGGGSTGKGGSPGKGGGPTNGGTGGYGGTYGKGGTGAYPGKGGSAGYPTMTGGAYPYGGSGGTGYGGTSTYGGRGSYGGTYGRGGRMGRGGSTYGGRGGFSGGPSEGGEAGQAGGGIGGYGGSPAALAACEAACTNLPSSCVNLATYEQCVQSCAPLSSEYPECSLELADYLNCLAGNLSPTAMCMVDSSGSCNGNGCLDSAETACTYWSSAFSDCTSGGCGIGQGIGPEFCSYDWSCPNHDHQTQCKLYDSIDDLWYCTCVIDSSQAFETYVQGYGTGSCQALSDACNVAR